MNTRAGSLTHRLQMFPSPSLMDALRRVDPEREVDRLTPVFSLGVGSEEGGRTLPLEPDATDLVMAARVCLVSAAV